MLWIPITLAAAALQTARNAFQRGLTGELTALGATYTRFLFGFPFAALYAAVVFAASGAPALDAVSKRRSTSASTVASQSIGTTRPALRLPSVGNADAVRAAAKTV